MTINKYDTVRSAKQFKFEPEGKDWPRYIKEGAEGQVTEVGGGRYLVNWGYGRDLDPQWHDASDLIEIPKMQVSRDSWLSDYTNRQRAVDTLQFEQRLSLEGAIKLWPELGRIGSSVDEAGRELLEWKLDSSPYSDEDLATWRETREGLRDVPLFSERGLYPLLGKDDARTVLALISNLLDQAGYQGRTR